MIKQLIRKMDKKFGQTHENIIYFINNQENKVKTTVEFDRCC